jgi:DNA (cytosine-5)-methyltransferase 1
VCELDIPAPALTVKSGGQWEFVQGKRSNATRRRLDEPASTMLFANDFASKGFRGPGGSLRLEIEQGLVLQGFARDYPVTGSASARWRQIGNAFPPPMACALLRALAPREEP